MLRNSQTHPKPTSNPTQTHAESNPNRGLGWVWHEFGLDLGWVWGEFGSYLGVSQHELLIFVNLTIQLSKGI